MAKRRKYILLVDDEESIGEVLQRAAVSEFPEATLIHVSSYSQAVTYLNGLNGIGPDLILLDVDLKSELTGLDLLDLIRQHPLGRLLPIIILSSNADPRLFRQVINGGANAFTLKPFTYADWKAYVRQLREFWFQTATTPRLYFDPSAV